MTVGPTPYQFRYARLIYIRWFLALPVLVALVGLTTSYLLRPVNPATAPVVAAVDAVPLVWAVAFGGPVLALTGSLLRKAWIAQAYVFAATAFAFYGATLLFGSLMTGGGWATASLAFGTASYSMTNALIYAKGR